MPTVLFELAQERDDRFGSDAVALVSAAQGRRRPTLSSPPFASLVGRPVRSRHPACASAIAVAMVAIAGTDAVSVAAPVLPAPIAFYLWMRTDGMLHGRLVSIQALDGIGAGIFGALCFLIIADLTRGSRHNNLALGASGACWGLGAALSNGVAGLAMDAAGYSTAFIFLACCATIALLTFWLGGAGDPHPAGPLDIG